MIKVSELTGAQLDYWVALADGLKLEGNQWRAANGYRIYWEDEWSPSTKWAQGGALMENHCIDVWHSMGVWYAERRSYRGQLNCAETPLQAICIAVVRAAFGDEVEEAPC